MISRPQPGLVPELRHWRWRQKADGRLLKMLVFGTSLPAIGFVCFPSPGSAFVLGIFLAALGAACLRLLLSAAKVAEINRLVHPQSETIDKEVLEYPDFNLMGPGPEASTESPLMQSARLARDASGLN